MFLFYFSEMQGSGTVIGGIVIVVIILIIVVIAIVARSKGILCFASKFRILCTVPFLGLVADYLQWKRNQS